jgi:transposase InsO family protein
MKGIFSENGIPAKVISDNGTHFTAGEFKQFAAEWGFEMVLSSPEYPQGHALIERHIQTIKKCMHKCDASGYDFDLALLVLRSTPLGPDMPSPAELLQQRRFRTTLPTYVPDPPMSEMIRQKLRESQDAAAAHYNKTAKSKPELVEGQPVRLYNKDTRRWEPAVVTGRAGTPRSYHVQRIAGGVPLRRNRVHLRSTPKMFDRRRYPTSEGEEEEEIVSSLPTTKRAMDNNTVEQPMASAGDASVEATTTPAKLGIRRSDRMRKQTQFYQAGHGDHDGDGWRR